LNDTVRIWHYSFADWLRRVADMPIRFVRLVRSLLLTPVILVALSATAATVSGPVVVLPNSYYLQPDKDGQTKLVKHDGSRLLPGHVAAYLVVGQIVTGAIGEVPPASHQFTNDLEFTGGPDTRYFILDTTSGKLETNLDEAAWHKRIQELGQNSPVHIYPPLPWQN
jgi:hypothetical protein